MPDGSTLLSLGFERLGGSWGYWFCGNCNSGQTARWDKEYLDWQSRIWAFMDAAGASPIPLPPTELTAVDPGAFARCVWAWVFATDETESLHISHQALADAIRTGDQIEPPIDLRLRLGATLGLAGRVSANRPGGVLGRTTLAAAYPAARRELWIPASSQTQIESLPLAVIVAPPFVAVFGAIEDRHDVDMFDLGPWLSEAAGQRRNVALMLPTVDVLDQSIRPIAYSDVVRLNAAV